MKLNKTKLTILFVFLCTLSINHTCHAAAVASARDNEFQRRAVPASVFAHLAYAKLTPGSLDEQELEGFNPSIRKLLPEGVIVVSDVCHDGVASGLESAAEALLASSSGIRAVTFQHEDGGRHLSFRGTKTHYGALTDGVLLACGLDRDPKRTLLDVAAGIVTDYSFPTIDDYRPSFVPESVVRASLRSLIRSSLEKTVDRLGAAVANSSDGPKDDEEASPAAAAAANSSDSPKDDEEASPAAAAAAAANSSDSPKDDDEASPAAAAAANSSDSPKDDEEASPAAAEATAWSVTGWLGSFVPASTVADDSITGLVGSFLWETCGVLVTSIQEASFDSLPEDMKMAFRVLNSGNVDDFRELMRLRLKTAIDQAATAIKEANAEGDLRGISGHSLGGIAAELAVAQLIAAGELDSGIEVTCFCSPGGRELFEFIGITPLEGMNTMHITRAGDIVSHLGKVSATHAFTIPMLTAEQVATAYEWLGESAPMHALVAHGIKPTVWALREGLAKRTAE